MHYHVCVSFAYILACMCMTEEMGWQLSAINEKKQVQVGDFRLDSDGTMKTNTVCSKISNLIID